MRRFFARAAFLCATVALVWASTGRASSAVVALPGLDPDQDGAAGAYCVKTGGQVIDRVPVYGTNGSDPLRLAGSREFCTYTAKDGSQIHLLLSTLYTTQPSLAALAYYAAPA